MTAPTQSPTDPAGRPPTTMVPRAAAEDSLTPDLTRVGGHVFWWGWAGLAAIAAAIALMNVLTRVHDAAANNLAEPVWRPVTYEVSSVLVLTLLYPAIWRLAQGVSPWKGGLARVLSVHVAGALGFAAVHIGAFVLIRKAVFALLGQDYRFGGLAPFFYELPKDLVTYAVVVVLVWGLARMFDGLPRPVARGPAGSVTFDIRDGAKVVRVRIDDILAVRSAGNYVEFLLADGRSPLMRATLAGVEAQLSPHGVARTHRSWLVNTGRIEAIDPARSGDFRLSLKGGIEAPLSRRFRPALKRADG